VRESAVPIGWLRRARTRAYAVALEAFRRLPKALRRLVVRHSTPNYTLGAVAVFRRGDHVLLVRSRHQAAWSLPGGLVQRDESPDRALRRELREELRLDVAIEELRPAATHVDTAVQSVTVIFVLDHVAAPQADGVEVLEARWHHPAELPMRLLRGTREALELCGVEVPVE
jgi:8-oxo-dGTP pyrophosphatase MutT (NUDIX family)